MSGKWQPTPVFLPGKSHGWKSLVGCSPWGRKESDTTERLYFHFSLSWIGEGNGNPLQCSCLENPRDGGAWWAAVYGVAQSQTWLKRLRSSSSSSEWKRGLYNSMKQWAMLRRATQDVQVIVKSSNKTWSTEGGNGTHSSILATRTLWTVWKSKKIWYRKMSSQVKR